MGLITFIIIIFVGIGLGSIGMYLVLTDQVPYVSAFFSDIGIPNPLIKNDLSNTGNITLNKENPVQKVLEGTPLIQKKKVATVGDLEFTLLGVEKTKTVITDGYIIEGFPIQSRDGAVYIILTIQIENVGKKTMELPFTYEEWTLTDSKSRVFEIGTTDIPYDGKFTLKLGPGLKATHKIGFEIPDDPQLALDLAYFGKVQ